MFTGLVQAVGVLAAREPIPGGARLTVAPPAGFAAPDDPVRDGESIAVDGACLTVVPGSDPDALRFDLSDETLARTTLGARPVGARVNLERALRVGDRLGGHLVQGHVDGLAEVVDVRPEGDGAVIRYRVPDAWTRFLADKGSATLDGISLTVVRPSGPEFEAWIIPHTLAATNLGDRRPGDRVNFEADAIAKYVESLVRPFLPAG